MPTILEQTEALVKPVCDEVQVELVDVEYVKEGQNFFLRIFVDTPGGIDIDQCAAVAEKLSELLDENDFIEEEYMLEVSSPGAERPLKTKSDLVQRIDSYINVKTYKAIDGQKEFEGYLRGFDEDTIKLEVMEKARKKTLSIPYDAASKIRLAIKF
ncbi:MAG: ribosome maturation factor RimP [Turicibacter sp.]|nr:ribosome maturation factor RimP [Turicibacter sp.]